MSDTHEIRLLLQQHLEDLRRAGVRQLPIAREMIASVEEEGRSLTDVADQAQLNEQRSALEPPAEKLTNPTTSKDLALQVSQDDRLKRPAAGSHKAGSHDTGFHDKAAEVATQRPGSDLSPQVAQQMLDAVNQKVQACQKCPELCTKRNKTVFGVGNPRARLLFLGEAPGADEDRVGEPFVGQAGQLLDKIIAACTLSRQDVYILNILKCRPPGNRNPTDQESSNCDEFLQSQLDIIQPEYICCLGSVAAQNLLDTQISIGKLRGKFHDWRGIQVLATYHPAYLLRNPPAKAEVWKDMQFLMNAMGIELPKR